MVRMMKNKVVLFFILLIFGMSWHPAFLDAETKESDKITTEYFEAEAMNIGPGFGKKGESPYGYSGGAFIIKYGDQTSFKGFWGTYTLKQPVRPGKVTVFFRMYLDPNPIGSVSIEIRLNGSTGIMQFPTEENEKRFSWHQVQIDVQEEGNAFEMKILKAPVKRIIFDQILVTNDETFFIEKQKSSRDGKPTLESILNNRKTEEK